MTDLTAPAPGVLRPGRWRWARTMVWMLALAIIVVLPFPVQSLVQAAIHPDPAIVAILGWAVIAASYLLYAVAVRKFERRAPTEIAVKPLAGDAAIGAVIGLGMFLLVIGILSASGVYSLETGHWTNWWQDLRNALVGALAEELVFRLVIFRVLLEGFGRWPALTLSAAIFGLVHLMNSHATFVGAVAIAVEAGLVLGSLFLLRNRIWMPVGAHAGWNFAEASIFGAALSGETGGGSLFVSRPNPEMHALISGGSFGPEASVVAVVVGLAVFTLVMARARR